MLAKNIGAPNRRILAMRTLPTPLMPTSSYATVPASHGASHGHDDQREGEFEFGWKKSTSICSGKSLRVLSYRNNAEEVST